ncbi:uncharacterized protein PG998_008593 [Apiospora kogelbergensis]|uniref:uncharacterized protein n=1 Tax=Apiospora kogelbergensis TaxID=1337665 RepID=UPI00312CD881
MDDLSGLDWSSTKSAQGTNKPNLMTMNSQGSNFYPSLRPSPSPQTTGRNTPMSAQGSGLGASKPATAKPGMDSFSNLVNFGGAKSNANLSLRERQEQMEAEKKRKAEEQKKQMQSQYGNGQFWDSLGQGSANASRTASPAVGLPQNGQANTGGDDDDLFAAFNRNTKVDNASHYPPPLQPSSGKSTPANAALDLGNPSAWSQPSAAPPSGGFGDDDDPFGLNEVRPTQSQQQAAAPPADDDDDFLGDLGKPVEEVRRKVQATQPTPQPGKPIEVSDSSSDSEPEPQSRQPRGGRGGDDPFDKAVAELVDMGFTPENARRGLTENGAGLNVQAAVGWLLDDAHKKNNGSPAWMRDDQPSNTPPAEGSSELQQRAAAMGASFFKTANTLWKTGQKQVQKAVAEFNQEGGGGDPNQPKWMRSAQQERQSAPEKQRPSATDEAMMLESGMRPERASRSREPQPGAPRFDSSRDRSPVLPMRTASSSSSAPKWQQASKPSVDPRARLNKQAIEEQSAQAYVSPSRRKKTTPQPQAAAEPEPDLLFNSTALPSRAQPSPAPAKPATPVSRTITPRPAAPTRQIPSVSPAVLQASAKHRTDGTAHFKRGDFDAAHTSYTNSLQGIPQAHPICIVLLTNRSLTALKTGSPKQAVEDADNAVKIIGPSHGEGEKVALEGGEKRDMKELYGKALSRKAEALEQMEKWSDAGNVWQLCVEAGVGGPTAIAGRQRCQKALAPKPKAAPVVAKPRPKPSALSDMTPQKSSEAVQRLRAANQAAEAADDEKFALSEKVDARISLWRDGKRDNLRALLGSMDQVLWEGSGWKKIGLHELVMANKVKINYMKAIAKTHPDKVGIIPLLPFISWLPMVILTNHVLELQLPQDASTEVKLIAGTVFATLNEAWDKFKAENGL